MDDTFSDSRWKMERQNRLATCEGETNQWSSCNCVPWCQEYSGWERNRTARREWASLETIGPLGKFKTDTFQKLHNWMRKPCWIQTQHPQWAEQFRVGENITNKQQQQQQQQKNNNNNKHAFLAPTLTDRQTQKCLDWYYMIINEGQCFLLFSIICSHVCTCIHLQGMWH